MTLLAGTSGWQYRHWKGSFYPKDLPNSRWLPYFSERFPTVEVNNTFYRLPERKTFESWRKATPDGFVVTVKASRYLTHTRRLNEPQPSVRKLMDAAEGLGEKLGPILLQLPPSFKAAPDRLTETLGAFPKGQKLAIEFRHDSWFDDEVRRILERFDAALCWADRKGKTLGPVWRTASWGYLRLHHGDGDAFRYTHRRLEHWAATLDDSFAHSDDLFVYFNNDMDGAAIEDCRTLEAIARERNFQMPKTAAATR